MEAKTRKGYQMRRLAQSFGRCGGVGWIEASGFKNSNRRRNQFVGQEYPGGPLLSTRPVPRASGFCAGFVT